MKIKQFQKRQFQHLNGTIYDSHVVYLVKIFNSVRTDNDVLFACSTLEKAFTLIKQHVIIEPVDWIFEGNFSIEICEQHVDIANRNNIKTVYTMNVNDTYMSAIVNYEFIEQIPEFFKSILEN